MARKRESVQEQEKTLVRLFYFRKKGAGTMARKYKRLRYEDRKVIEKMSREGSRVIDIANTLGVHKDTIYKEYTRCGVTPDTSDTYSAKKAQEML